jgi:hypothetical protein
MKTFESMTRRGLLLAITLTFIAGFALTGCHDPGPAEEAGREIDEAVEDARDALDELGDEAEEAVEEVEEGD